MGKDKRLYTIFIYTLAAVILLGALAAWFAVSVRRRSRLTPVTDGWVVETKGTLFPTVMVRTGFSGTRVAVDDTVLYESDGMLNEHGRLTGTRVLFLPLPKDADGKVLHIERAGGYDVPLFGNYEDLFRLFFLEAFPALAVGAFLMLFGIVFLFLTSGFSVAMGDTPQHIFGALACIDLGVWLMCSYGLSNLFLRDPYGAAVERMALILIFPLFLFLLYFLRDDYDVLKQGIAMFAGCAVIYCSILFLGMVGHVQIDRAATIVQVLACLLFVMSQIMSYYLNISSSYVRQKEYESLAEKAYVDALTGLPNRKRAQDVFRGLNSTLGSYCIVSLDLDNLKVINDRFGHHEGDEMLIRTADILNACFGEKGFRARMGGDEFVVVLKHTAKEGVDVILEEINAHLAAAGQTAHGVDYSISYGYAFKEECPGGNSADVFKLADERMYEQKAAKKGRTVRRAS